MRCTLSRGASLLAVAAILAAAPDRNAQAQSFNATGVFSVGAGAIDVATAGQTTVSLDLPVAVIDWSTNEAAGAGPINFQSAGTTATFVNRDAADFTVLNRILPNDITRPVQFNGTVISQLQTAATGAVTRGGTLFFYSPGGIVVGPTGVFNVGNLVLTASDLPLDPVTGAFGTAGTYSFLPANAGSRVELRPGAQITAGPNSAYVALVAPRVINAGTINVDGSAVIVAADASTITFRPNGLFDIQIDQGTSATGEVVTNTGTITGPAGTATAAHRVYFVAVPRNDAITMAIQAGSTLGFDVAGAADVDGNAIVLSAGYNIAAGTIEATRALASAPVSAGLAIGAITATSQVTGQATGTASLTINAAQAGNFASNVSLSGVQDPAAATTDSAFVIVSGVGSTLDITGDLTVRSLDAGFVLGNTAPDSTPAHIDVSQGRLTVQGDATIDASRTGFAGNAAIGGAASLTARNGATVDLRRNLLITGDGVGEATGSSVAVATGSGTGGSARLLVDNGSSVAVIGSATVRANGDGGLALDTGLVGGPGTGGTARVEGGIGGGTITVGGTLGVQARGTGADGSFCFFCGVEGGAGLGGSAGIDLTPALNLTANQAVTVDATGTGGKAADPSSGTGGGAGTGGEAFVFSTGGSLTALASLSVRASGVGGIGALDDIGVSGSTGFGGSGGDGLGGLAIIGAGDAGRLGGTGAIAVTGGVGVQANGIGGAGGTGGSGSGGIATLSARQGTASGASLSVQAFGVGGASASSGTAGAGLGGNAAVIAYSAVEGGANVSFAGTTINARGTGGAGSTPLFGGGAGSAGGSGTGGQAQALAQAGNGVLSLGGLVLAATGAGGAGGGGGSAVSVGPGGNGGAGGAGTGGTVRLGVVAGLATGGPASGSASFGGTTANAGASGGLGGASGTGGTPGVAGTGGSAVGGYATLNVQGGPVTFGGNAIIEADAAGGDGGSGTGTGGAARIGRAGGVPGGVQLIVEGGNLTGADFLFSAQSTGGKGGTAGAATVFDQPLSFLLNGGSITAGNLDFLTVGDAASASLSSVIALTGGDTTLTGNLNFSTPGTLTATFDGADVRSVNAAITAGDWLEGGVPVGTAGSLFATGDLLLTSGNDIFAHLSGNSGNALTVIATGRVRLDDLTSLAAVTVNAGTTISLGNIAAGSIVSANAPGDVAVGTVSAGSSAVLFSGAALSSGAVTAGQNVDYLGLSSLTVSGAAQAGDSVLLGSGGDITTGSLSAGLVSPSAAPTATYGIIVSADGALALGDLAAAHDITLFTPQSVSAGSISGREVLVLADGAQTLGAITAPGRVLLAGSAMTAIGGDPFDGYDLGAVFAALPIAGSGPIRVAGPTAAGALTAISLGDVTVGGVVTTRTAAASGAVDLRAGGALVAGDILAGGSVLLESTAASVTAGSIGSLAGTVGITAPGAVAAGAVQAALGLSISSGADIGLVSGATDSGDLLLDGMGTITSGNLAAASGMVALFADGAIGAGNLSGTSVAATAGASLGTGAVTATSGSVSLTAAGDLTGASISASNSIALVSTGGGVAVGDLASSGSSVGLTANGAASSGNISAANGITASAGGNLGVTSASTAAGDVTLDAGADLTAGDLTASAGRVLAAAGGAGALGNLAAAGLSGGVGLRVSAGTTLALGSATAAAGELRLVSVGAMTAGDLAGSAISLAAGTTLTTGQASASSGGVTLSAASDIIAAGLSAPGAITVSSSGGAVTAAAVTAGGNLTLVSAADLAAGALRAGGALLASGRVVRLADVSAASARLSAGGDLAFGDVTTLTGDVVIGSAGAVTGGAIAAGGRIALSNSAGAVTLGNLAAAGNILLSAAGDLGVGDVRTASETVELRANAGSLTAGSITAGTDTALIASGDLAVGTVRARDILLLAGGAVRGVSLVSPDGRILAASNSLGTAGGAIGEYNFNAVFAEPLVAAGGGITLTGPVTGGTFTAAVAGDAQLQGIAASRSILVDAGGAVQLGGVWRAPSITLRANDLVMPAGSGLNAGVSGTISLVSRNAAGLRIGDGLDGSVVPDNAFSLSNAEWGRINSGSLSVFGLDGAGAVDILIGKLDVTGPDAGSTIDDPAGSVRFSTGDAPTAGPSGTIRVAGALQATGFRAANALIFRTGQFQLAADTGSIAVLGRGDTLSGSLRIEASDIHVAATPLLAQLYLNPFFTEVELALDQKSAGGSGPVVRAGALDFTVGRSFYIQRTGSGSDPLGFEEPLDGFKVRPAGSGRISVIINGTFRTAAGLVSGAEAWRQFKASGADISGFAADSRLNGCLLAAATCGVDVPDNSDSTIRPLIDVIEKPPLDDAPADPEKPEEKGDPAVQSAILSPAVLLPVRPENLSGQVDEPIAGSGNPALIGGQL